MRASAAGLRRPARAAAWWWLHRRLRALSDDELRQDAWVIAPHPDDECLGCGGTILRKTALGARVRVVFVSDGSSSHADRCDRAELAVRRLEEARAACGRLGVRADDVHFAALEDLKLTEHVAEGADRLHALLAAEPTPQVLMPYSGEPPPDHRATWEMGRIALERAGAPVTVLEYPVWFWDAFPWMGDAANRGWSIFPMRMRRFPGHLARSLRDFRASVEVGPVLESKREALAHHATQMERLADDPDWATLESVSDGEFLACCLRSTEVFHRYAFEPQSRPPRSV